MGAAERHYFEVKFKSASSKKCVMDSNYPVSTYVHRRLRRDDIENAHGLRCVGEYALLNQAELAAHGDAQGDGRKPHESHVVSSSMQSFETNCSNITVADVHLLDDSYSDSARFAGTRTASSATRTTTRDICICSMGGDGSGDAERGHLFISHCWFPFNCYPISFAVTASRHVLYLLFVHL